MRISTISFLGDVLSVCPTSEYLFYALGPFVHVIKRKPNNIKEKESNKQGKHSEFDFTQFQERVWTFPHRIHGLAVFDMKGWELYESVEIIISEKWNERQIEEENRRKSIREFDLNGKIVPTLYMKDSLRLLVAHGGRYVRVFAWLGRLVPVCLLVNRVWVWDVLIEQVCNLTQEQVLLSKGRRSFQMIVGCGDNTVEIFSVVESKQGSWIFQVEWKKRIVCEKNVQLYCMRLKKMNDGNVIIVAGSVLNIILFWKFGLNDEQTGHSLVLAYTTGQQGACIDVAWTSNFNYLASISDDRAIRIWSIGWNCMNVKLVSTSFGHTSRIWSVKILEVLNETPLVLTAGEDGTVKVWTLFNGCLLYSWKYSDSSVRSLGVGSPELMCDYFAVGAADSSVKTMTVEYLLAKSRQKSFEFFSNSTSGLNTVVLPFKNLEIRMAIILKFNEYLAVMKDGSIFRVQIKEDRWNPLISSMNFLISSFVISKSRDYMIVGSTQGGITILQLNSPAFPLHFTHGMKNITFLDCYEIGSLVFIFSSDALGFCKLWRFSHKENVQNCCNFELTLSRPFSAATVVFFNNDNGKLILQNCSDKQPSDSIKFSVLIGDQCGRVHIFQSGVEAIFSKVQNVHHQKLCQIRFCEQTKKLWTLGHDGFLKRSSLQFDQFGVCGIEIEKEISLPEFKPANFFISNCLHKTRILVAGFENSFFKLVDVDDGIELVSLPCSSRKQHHFDVFQNHNNFDFAFACVQKDRFHFFEMNLSPPVDVIARPFHGRQTSCQLFFSQFSNTKGNWLFTSSDDGCIKVSFSLLYLFNQLLSVKESGDFSLVASLDVYHEDMIRCMAISSSKSENGAFLFSSGLFSYRLN